MFIKNHLLYVSTNLFKETHTKNLSEICIHQHAYLSREVNPILDGEGKGPPLPVFPL